MSSPKSKSRCSTSTARRSCTAGFILGQMVRRTRDPELIIQLTRHSAEEVMHAQLWTETIVAVGGRPAPVRERTRRDTPRGRDAADDAREYWRSHRCSSAASTGISPLHLRRPGLSSRDRGDAQRMLDEERGHLVVGQALARQAG